MQVGAVRTQTNYYANRVSMGNAGSKLVNNVNIQQMTREALSKLATNIGIASERGDRDTVRVLIKAYKQLSTEFQCKSNRGIAGAFPSISDGAVEALKKSEMPYWEFNGDTDFKPFE